MVNNIQRAACRAIPQGHQELRGQLRLGGIVKVRKLDGGAGAGDWH